MRTCAGADFYEKMADAQLVGVSFCGLPQKKKLGRTFFAGGKKKFCGFFLPPVGEKKIGGVFFYVISSKWPHFDKN